MYGATETAPLVTAVRRLEARLDGAAGGDLRAPAGRRRGAHRRPRGPHPAGPRRRRRGRRPRPERDGRLLEQARADRGGARRRLVPHGRPRRLDDDGYLYLVDRAKDMIVSGGENVYSTEVEDVLYRHPAVREAAVFGIPDGRWGEAVHAVVVAREAVGEEELIAHCRASIAGYKVPKRIELREEPLPKSGAGKVLKRELRAPYWEGRESMVSGA